MTQDLSVLSRKIKLLDAKILKIQSELCEHKVFQQLYNIRNIQTFMEYHSFAVWDFMTILKTLQLKLTCTEIPWRPSPYLKKVIALYK